MRKYLYVKHDVKRSMASKIGVDGKSTEKTDTVIIGCRVTPNLRNNIKKAAEHLGLSTSEFYREAIIEKMKLQTPQFIEG